LVSCLFPIQLSVFNQHQLYMIRKISFAVLTAVLFLATALPALSQTISIREAKRLTSGTVTVAGIVTSPNFRSAGYGFFIQDNSSPDSNACYIFKSSSLSGYAAPTLGDSLQLTATISIYNNLYELTPTAITKLGTGTIPAPRVTVLPWTEPLEGEFLRINKVKFDSAGHTFYAGTSGNNYNIRDAAGNIGQVRILPVVTSIVGTTIPSDSVNIAGLLSQYSPSDPFSGYEFEPRSLADLNVQDSTPSPGTLISIADARGRLVGSKVTVKGIVTSTELGVAIPIQDNTAGITVYSTAFAAAVHKGDSVIVSGPLQDFNTLLEIGSGTAVLDSFRVINSSNLLPSPILLTTRGFAELYESMLVKVSAAVITGSGNFSGNTNYPITDVAGTGQMRIVTGTNLVGTAIPANETDITGILGAYSNVYQLQPRTTADLVQQPGPGISVAPYESLLDTNKIQVTWKTLTPSSSVVRYGRTAAYELGAVGDSTPVTTHIVTLSSLSPCTIYNIRASSSNASGTSIGNNLISITSSKSSGVMNVYFNYSIDTTLALGERANGNVDLASKVINRINAATYSIDFALYSINLQPVIDALIAAKNRGVRVRGVSDGDNSVAGFGQLTSAGISISSYVNSNVDTHNKFFIFDGRDSTNALNDWVWTGSFNITSDIGGTGGVQNSIEIQDASLAKVYQTEFEEMFGSTGEIANPTNARFSTAKTDITPHRVNINGTLVQVYFCPSDNVADKVLTAIASAERTFYFEQLNFTRSDFATATIGLKNAGVGVSGIVETTTGTGVQYPTLVAAGIDVLNAGANPNIYVHSKYAIIDAALPARDPLVLTGSMNWSASSISVDDENLLIIHSDRISRLYAQEFSARYKSLGGTSILLGTASPATHSVTSYKLEQNYPNPFNPATTISFSLPTSAFVHLTVYDVLGREVATLVNESKQAGSYAVRLDASRLSSGIYFYRLSANATSDAASNFVQTKKMVFVK
jgi:phosphatidylserine/phosphatidylglycerophosphate/cardiolipin synthase-like enzyme